MALGVLIAFSQANRFTLAAQTLRVRSLPIILTCLVCGTRMCSKENKTGKDVCGTVSWDIHPQGNLNSIHFKINSTQNGKDGVNPFLS